MKKLNKLICAVALSSVGGIANANVINLDAGNSTSTPISYAQTASNIEDFGFQINGATSQYFDTNGSAGFVDAGDFFVDMGTTGILSLNGTSTSNSQCPGGLTSTQDCYGNSWDISADYLLYGAVVDTGAGLAGGIGGGYFNFMFNDKLTSTSTQVASLAIVGSGGPINTSVGVNIDAVVDYSFLGGVAPSALIHDFFNFGTPVQIGGVPSTNWYDLWAAGMAASPAEFINALAVTTLNGIQAQTLPGIETLSYGSTIANVGITGTLSPFQKALFDGAIGSTLAADGFLATTFSTVSRTGEKLSGNISAKIPEPTSIAILGLGLLGFAGAARRRKS